MRKLLLISAIILLFMLGILLGWYGGIRHAMEDSQVSVYLDGVVEIQLDGCIYTHEAF